MSGFQKGQITVWDYGWNDPITFHGLTEPKEIAKTKNLLDGIDLLKPSAHSVIWDTISSIVNSKCVSFYTGSNKTSIFDYKPFEKWTSKPLLSCEYALMLDVLKTA